MSNTCVIHARFLRNLEFLEGFSEKKDLKYQISRKYVQWESNYSMLTDRHDEA